MAELNDVLGGEFEPDYRVEGSRHVYSFEELKYEVALSRITTSGEVSYGRLEVRSFFPGDPKRLLTGHVNISGPRARADLARQLEGISLQAVDWKRILEVAFVDVIDRLEEGSPTVSAIDIPSSSSTRFRLQPLAFDGLPVIWFGRGGSGKSLLALASAIDMQTGAGLTGLQCLTGNVLYCDWELDSATWKRQLGLLCAGAGIEVPDIRYRECKQPLIHEGEAIARYIAQHDIQVVFLDSLGMACSGDKNANDVAMPMMNIIRGWGVTVICIDHLAKAEGTNTPYGSAYFETSVRATWRAKGRMEEGGAEHFVSMQIEKTNLGRFPQQGFRFLFEPDAENPVAIRVQQVQAQAMPSMLRPEKMNHREMIKQCLLDARRAMTVGEIADEIGIKEGVVRARLAEMARANVVIRMVINYGGATKWAMRAPSGMEWDGQTQ